jgi:hypothetical protein
MQVSHPNEHGVLPEGHTETLARHGRAHVTITFALCDDGQFRYGLSMMYSHGGFSTPISGSCQGFSSIEAARTAAIERMLCRWHSPFPSDPASVHEELRKLREQLESHLRQPSLF